MTRSNAMGFRRAPSRESGQAMTIFLLALGLFLIGAAGFAVDMANLWFHRQVAQDVADAACTAGAMDLLANAQGNSLGGWGTVTVGTAFSCGAKPGSAPCKYAVANGLDGGGLIAGQASNDVSVSFPDGSGCPGASCPAPGVTPAPASLAPIPFIRVDVVDRVRVMLAGMIMGSLTSDVRAFAVCGLDTAQSPVPLVVLDPQNPSSGSAVNVQGSGQITIVGGPDRSIQVNSNAATAVSLGGSASIDLTKAGPDFAGGDLGVFGGPATAPSGFTTAGSGAWQSPSTPVSDPFAQIAAPTMPASKDAPNPAIPGCTSIPCTVSHNVHGCPDTTCTLYTGGYYSSGITVQNATAIFEPGVYYLNGGLGLKSNSTVRPGTGTGNGTGGTVFYLTGSTQKCSGQTGLVCVGSNSGRSVDPFVTSAVQCPGGSPPDSRLNLPATVNGNILLAPCSGTYGGSSGHDRGILFFGDRSNNGGGGWGGGGGFLLAGAMYFHHCNASGTGTSCGQAPAAYDAVFSLQGNSGSCSYVLGQIITDNLSMSGTPSVTMALNPNPTNSLLKASLYR